MPEHLTLGHCRPECPQACLDNWGIMETSETEMPSSYLLFPDWKTDGYWHWLRLSYFPWRGQREAHANAIGWASREDVA